MNPSAELRSKISTSDRDSLILKSTGVKLAVWMHVWFKADEEGRLKVQDAMVCPSGAYVQKYKHVNLLKVHYAQ